MSDMKHHPRCANTKDANPGYANNSNWHICRDADGHKLSPWAVTDEPLTALPLPPELPADELLPTMEKVGYSPDHPRVEVRYYDPNGFSVEMSIEVPDEIKPYYDADMALNSAGYAVQRLMSQVQQAKRNHEEQVPDGSGD